MFEMASAAVASPQKLRRIGDNSKQLVQGARHQAQHPLLNDLILDNLLGYCEFEDLASCRRVSKQWFKLSFPHWLNKAPVLQLRLELYGTAADKGNIMSKFLHSVQNDFHQYGPYEFAGLRQYRKFEMKKDTYFSEQHQFQLQHFFRNGGEWITHLKLDMKFSDWDTYQAVMLSRMTPNLAHLEANINFSWGIIVEDGVYDVEPEAHKKLATLKIDFEFNDVRRGLPVIGWIALLQRYPNLKTIVHFVDDRVRLGHVDRMLEAIWSIRQADKKLLDLKRLEIGSEEYGNILNSNSLLPLFRDTGLALETFRASIGNETPNQRIYEVLDSQASTLKKLTLHLQDRFRGRGPEPEQGQQEFQPPEMKLVETLVVNGWLFRNFGFLKSFPALKSLTFGGGATYEPVLDETTEEHLEGVMIPTLETLHSDYKYLCTRVKHYLEGSFVCYGRLLMLSRSMPNLRNLQVCVDNEAFRMVCKCWPRLEHLTLLGDAVDDEGITGITDEEEQRLEFNITTLQGLRSLTMKDFNYDNRDEDYVAPTAITEMSLPAILALPRLEKLDITMNKKLDVDKHVIDTLTSKIKSCSITFAKGIWEEEEEDEGSQESEASAEDEYIIQHEGNDDREGDINGTSDDSDDDDTDMDNNDDEPNDNSVNN